MNLNPYESPSPEPDPDSRSIDPVLGFPKGWAASHLLFVSVCSIVMLMNEAFREPIGYVSFNAISLFLPYILAFLYAVGTLFHSSHFMQRFNARLPALFAAVIDFVLLFTAIMLFT